jgi:hypothetical protein
MITRLAGQIITQTINNKNDNNDNCTSKSSDIEASKTSLSPLPVLTSTSNDTKNSSIYDNFIPKVNFPFLVLLASGTNLT